MRDLLFLCHRIPYPPNKGDKIRSFNLLRHLAQRYRVHLATFIDDPADWRHVGEVKKMCGETCFTKLNPRWAKVRSLAGFLTGQPLTLPYYRSKEIQVWVDNLLVNKDIGNVVVFSSAMAQYMTGRLRPDIHSVIDFVDIDSEKWRQYAGSRGWPMNWVYRREGRELLRFERLNASRFKVGVFVSAAEAGLFRELAPEAAEHVTHVSNGVDTDYFAPDASYPNPYPPENKVLVFTGAMDYWANVDAVSWFARETLPLVRARIADVQFYIVGARPGSAVYRLAELPGITVTGAVHDIRPYIAHAQVAVAPMRIARGIQNKVLEAMALARPVLVTPEGLDGIRAIAGEEVLVEAHADGFAARLVELLTSDRGDVIGQAARARVVADFSWQENLARFERLLHGASAAAATESKQEEVGGAQKEHTG